MDLGEDSGTQIKFGQAKNFVIIALRSPHKNSTNNLYLQFVPSFYRNHSL